MADTMLSVVDEQDEVVGRQLRSVIHRQGLRHREVHVWFVTDDAQVIVQRRSPLKDTNPNMLGASVGGHVEEGQEYLEAALMEVSEETGFELFTNDLMPLLKVDLTHRDRTTDTVNTVFRMVYMYRFSGHVQDLQVEAGDGAGFELVPLADIVEKRVPLVTQMAPELLEGAYFPVWKALQKAVFAA